MQNSQNLVMYFHFNDLFANQKGGQSVGEEGAATVTFLNALIEDRVEAVLKVLPLSLSFF